MMVGMDEPFVSDQAPPVYATVSKTFQFHAAHRLMRHLGKCVRLHGHTYQVEVSVSGSINTRKAPDEGMVVDFDTLKDAWAVVDQILDHRTILQNTDPLVVAITETSPDSVVVLTTPPTAEAIAAKILDLLPEWISRVRVWETPTSWAEVVRK